MDTGDLPNDNPQPAHAGFPSQRRRQPLRPRPVPIALAVAAALAIPMLIATGWDALFGAPVSSGPIVTFPVGPAEDAAAPLLRVAVLGDVGTGDQHERATAGLVADAAGDDPYDALVLLGDNVYPNGDPARLGATVFEPFAPVLAEGTALLAVLGNHDVLDGNAAGQVGALGMPDRWYGAEVGPVLIVVLDSTLVDDDDQTRWLDDTLAATDARWVIVAMHHPAYSAGFHGSDERVQAAWVPLFERHGVELVLAGHDHDYQRSHVVNGVTYVVSGGGARLRPTGAADFTAYSLSVRHFVDIAVFADRIVFTAVGADGPFDGATLVDNVGSGL